MDTTERELTGPADQIIGLIKRHYTDKGEDVNAHNTYEIACKVLRQRLNIDTFTAKGKK